MQTGVQVYAILQDDVHHCCCICIRTGLSWSDCTRDERSGWSEFPQGLLNRLSLPRVAERSICTLATHRGEHARDRCADCRSTAAADTPTALAGQQARAHESTAPPATALPNLCRKAGLNSEEEVVIRELRETAHDGTLKEARGRRCVETRRSRAMVLSTRAPSLESPRQQFLWTAPAGFAEQLKQRRYTGHVRTRERAAQWRRSQHSIGPPRTAVRAAVTALVSPGVATTPLWVRWR